MLFVSCVCGPAAVALDVVAAAVDIVAVVAAAAVVIAAVVYTGRGHRLSPSIANNMIRRHTGPQCNCYLQRTGPTPVTGLSWAGLGCSGLDFLLIS